jgi:hypothetical protein
MTTLREAAQLAVTMLKTGMPEYDAHDVLEVLEAALEQSDGPCPTCVALARTVMMDQMGTA